MRIEKFISLLSDNPNCSIKNIFKLFESLFNLSHHSCTPIVRYTSLSREITNYSKNLSKFSASKNTIKSSLCFLPVFLPVFSRQIVRYLSRKNNKTSSKENLKPDPSKIKTGSKK